jgi:hypothetical protein
MGRGTHAAPVPTGIDGGQSGRMVGRLVPVLATVVACLVLAVIAVVHPDEPARPEPGATTARLVDSPVPAPSSTQDVTSPEVPPGRSKAGAVNAAAGYATLLARLFPLDVARARAIVAQAASEQARDRLVAAIDANLLPLQEKANAIEGTTTYRQAVLATRLVSYAADSPARAGTTAQNPAAAGARARVRVWTVLTVSQTPQSPDQNSNAIGSFGTVSLSLTWERGAWRIDDSTTVDGPTPLIDGTPSTGAALDSALRGFVDWRPR